jgi:hypothetical protein
MFAQGRSSHLANLLRLKPFLIQAMRARNSARERAAAAQGNVGYGAPVGWVGRWVTLITNVITGTVIDGCSRLVVLTVRFSVYARSLALGYGYIDMVQRFAHVPHAGMHAIRVRSCRRALREGRVRGGALAYSIDVHIHMRMFVQDDLNMSDDDDHRVASLSLQLCVRMIGASWRLLIGAPTRQFWSVRPRASLVGAVPRQVGALTRQRPRRQNY